jgi:hypothetical protein
MWLRSDKRELRNRPKEKFVNHRKKRKRSRNQYCKTIKLMKNEKKESVLIAKQYSTDELTLYDKTSSNKKIFTSNSSFAPDCTSVNQFHHHSQFDLNNIHTSSIDDAADENTALDYGSSGSVEHFQPLNTHHQYDDFVDCNYAKTTSEIHANMLISKFSLFLHFDQKLNLSFLQDRVTRR